MSGGISAIKGFDYQATVILDRLFDHFDKHGSAAKVRPEGIDDLDLSWSEGGNEYRRYEQIKKPREDNDGNLKRDPWTLSEVVRELLPNTLRQLSGNGAEQVWILGDEVDDAVSALVQAGANAPAATVGSYWSAVHGLTRNAVLDAVNIDPAIRDKLLRWRIPATLSIDSSEALAVLASEFADLAKKAGAELGVAEQYRRMAAQLHGCLPGILARTGILPTYGSEQEVAARVYGRLEQRYSLQRAVVESTMFRNLAGFISDISKQPGRSFALDEFELELRGVWPRMLPIRDVPSLDSDHISRLDLSERFTTRWTGKAVEGVGISGSGKTTLAAEVVDQLRTTDPTRRVYYADVRPEVAFRDVLVGTAFHLRRIGIVELFAVSVESGPGDEEALKRLARAYSAVPQNVMLLIDLVEGTCSDVFARDLATFIRALSSPACRIAVLGQESALRELSPLEQDEHDVVRVDIRGFRYEEFVSLVTHYHGEPDRAALREIYHRITAGRAAGMFAKLAHSLARAQSLQDMSEMASRPAEDILSLAEQRRFARISDGARGAAERLVCFAMPFRRADAEQIFPDDNVGAAIRELLRQGLLRSHDEDSFEMHETVRAGLEGTIALNLRRSSHESLAAWYHAQGLASAEVLHLERAGKPADARNRAREAFLRGKQWAALSPYVIGHKLASAAETIRAFASSETVEDQYLLSNILRALGEPVAVDDLCGILYSQPERYYGDYQRGLALVEAILEFEPDRLHELIVFSIEKTRDPTRSESALDWLMIAARRKEGLVGPRTLAFFTNQPSGTKRLLIRFLMLDRRRDTLQAAFQFLASEPELAGGPHPRPLWRELGLSISNRNEAIEFLAAMPTVTPAATLAAKRALP